MVLTILSTPFRKRGGDDLQWYLEYVLTLTTIYLRHAAVRSELL